MNKTPLEDWIKGKVFGTQTTAGLARSQVARYQLQKIRENVARARSRSPFYARHLRGLGESALRRLEDLAGFPFTTAADLRREGMRFLCVSQDEIERVVTLHSSGSTAPPKRLWFTESDLERTVDFFCHGMSTLVRAGDRVLILMPGEAPGSVGDLLVKGLERLGVEGHVHGPVLDPAVVVDAIHRMEMDSMVGLPLQVLSLARCAWAGRTLRGRIRTVLLCSDYVPAVVARELEAVWNCRVFTHYGMTEMGLGGGVECEARCGYHLREADLFFEIIHPETGRPQEEGKSGEIVFTTLTQEGMPLIRYRTGDISRFLPGPCPCGTSLRRLERVQGRLEGTVFLGDGHRRPINITHLDEALLPAQGLLDYEAVVRKNGVQDVLALELQVVAGKEERVAEEVLRRLGRMPAIRQSMGDGTLSVEPPRFSRGFRPSTGSAKRRILEERGEEEACRA